ncbi:MAG: SlyX family protein [Pseudomonadota bacterium]
MDRIEEKLAHLERLVEDLDGVVARQDREITVLRAQVARLIERDAAREGDGGVVLGDERPPHY